MCRQVYCQIWVTYGSPGVCELLEKVRRFILFRNLGPPQTQTAGEAWYFSEKVRMWEIVRVILVANSKHVLWRERRPATFMCLLIQSMD